MVTSERRHRRLAVCVATLDSNVLSALKGLQNRYRVRQHSQNVRTSPYPVHNHYGNNGRRNAICDVLAPDLSFEKQLFEVQSSVQEVSIQIPSMKDNFNLQKDFNPSVKSLGSSVDIMEKMAMLREIEMEYYGGILFPSHTIVDELTTGGIETDKDGMMNDLFYQRVAECILLRIGDEYGGCFSPAPVSAFVHSVREAFEDKLQQRVKSPYRNFRHGVDVMHFTFMILQDPQISEWIGFEEKLSLILSALCHDLGQEGISNSIFRETNDDLKHKNGLDSSLEKFHATAASKVLMEHMYSANGMFISLGESQIQGVLESIKELIRATDMSLHRQYFDEFTYLAARGSFSGNMQLNETERFIVLKFIIKCADISNVARPWQLTQYWLSLIAKESRQQSAEPVLGQSLPSILFVVEAIQTNRKRWEIIREAEETTTNAISFVAGSLLDNQSS